MSHVIATPAMDAAPHRLAAAPADRHDPVVRDLVRQAAEEARARGHEEGRREGIATAADHAQQVATAVVGAMEQAVATAEAARAEQVEALFDLAVAMAETVLGREPHDGGAAVAAQVRDALDQVVDPHATVHVHPDDVDLVTEAMADRPVEVVGDRTLAHGDARVRGGWAEVDLTRAAAWRTIRQVLDAH